MYIPFTKPIASCQWGFHPYSCSPLSLIFKHDASQDSPLKTWVVLYIFSKEVTLDCTNICEILCLWYYQFSIVTTKDRRVIMCSGWILWCAHTEDYTVLTRWNWPHICGLLCFKNQLRLADHLVCGHSKCWSRAVGASICPPTLNLDPVFKKDLWCSSAGSSYSINALCGNGNRIFFIQANGTNKELFGATILRTFLKRRPAIFCPAGYKFTNTMAYKEK